MAGCAGWPNQVGLAVSGVRRRRIDPSRYGVRAPLASLRGGDVRTNAAVLLAILRGERSPRADVVALNAALALVVCDRARDLRDGFELARATLHDGAALRTFHKALEGAG